MRRHISTLVIATALIGVSPAAGQSYPAGGWYRPGVPAGYWVTGWGYYDGAFPAPAPGIYQAYYGARPLVTLADQWGRVADVPLRPKVLYYSDQIMTPYGGFYPTSIVVIPNERRPPIVAGPSRAYYPSAPSASPVRKTVPIVKPAPSDPPIPRAADFDRPADPPAPVELDRPMMPAIPALPKLPEVPPAPGQARPAAPAGNKAPRLGPAPMDSVLPTRPVK